MNDTELELLARRSVHAVRDEAERIASTDEAWRRLSAGRPPVDVGDRVAGAFSIVGLQQMAPQAEHNTRRWVVAAAAVAVLVVGGIVVFDRGGDGSLAPADTLLPTVAPTPTSDDSAIAPSLPPSTLVTASSTAPELSADASIEETIHSPIDEYVDITDVVVDNPDPLVGEELHRFNGAGDGPNQLGFEPGDQCSMCISPWGPVVASDGQIVIADEFNRRWVVVTDGDPEVIPYPPGLSVIGQPAIDTNDTIYAPTVSPDEAGRMSVGRLIVATVDELAAPQLDAEITPVGNSRVWFDGTAVVVNGDQVEGVDVPPFEVPDAAFGTSAGYATQVNVRWESVHRTWDFGDTAIAGLTPTTALTDGTVLVVEIDSQRLVALTTDGRAFRQPLPPVQLVSQNGFVAVAGDSIIRLDADGDDFVVRRNPLPQPPVVDPLDGVLVPDFAEPSLDDVPRLIPTDISALTGVSLRRREAAGDASPIPTHSQIWVRSASNGIVGASVAITTRPTGAYSVGAGTPLEVPGRPRAYRSVMDPSTELIQVVMPGEQGGGASVVTSGLQIDDAVRIAADMTWDAELGGWAVPELAGGDWVEVESAWESGSAARTLLDATPDTGPVALELTVATGSPIGLLGPSPGSNMVLLVQVGGAQALLYDEGSRLAVEWSPRPGVTVLMGSMTVDRDRLLALADSLTEVDEATWEAFAPLDERPGDGCDSMFC